MTTLTLTPDLREACTAHHPGDWPAVTPHEITPVEGGLRAKYRCGCGRQWTMRWGADGWPLERLEAA